MYIMYFVFSIGFTEIKASMTSPVKLGWANCWNTRFVVSEKRSLMTSDQLVAMAQEDNL